VPSSPATVLLIDDHDALRALARRYLEQGGYAVHEAASGRDALAKLREGLAANYVVTDLKMTDGSGGWLLAQLGYEFPALLARTLIVTGAADGAAAAHVAARWRCPLLAKPFDGQALVRAIGGLAAA
jgi:DNA-binding NtrC family response regulator